MNQELKKLNRDELYALLAELTSLTKENADFVTLRLQNKPDEALEYYKEKIKSFLSQDKINLREARKAIATFKRMSPRTEYLLELMLFYVETGEKIEQENGDLYEAFYNSMETMFEQIITTLNKNKELIPQFKTRLNSIIDRSNEGWAHKETLEEIYDDLEKD